jgi:hypothetical protein
LLFFNKFGLIEKKHYPVLLLATAAHVLNDYLLSAYKFLYPFADTEFQVFAFNSLEDLLVESVLVVVFALVMFSVGDVRRMRTFMKEEKDKLVEKFSLRKAISRDSIPFYLFFAFYTVSVLEFLVYVYLSRHGLLAVVWYKWLFLAVFVLYLVVLTVMVLPHSKRLEGVQSVE